MFFGKQQFSTEDRAKMGISNSTCPLRSRPPNRTISGAVPNHQRTEPNYQPYHQPNRTEPNHQPNRTKPNRTEPAEPAAEPNQTLKSLIKTLFA
ncbi:hypothetical protein BpHYR1_037579 [Brachionus plicatilis]|uniref:Uncharacterized protein n=1 Tax=Brachionus plicatilis TaxID=10195 RepID=A0A3M7T4L9_BRAPC|nr:hypothetical protein BpHYR1_037579 [Brachionus plicatilis]